MALHNPDHLKAAIAAAERFQKLAITRLLEVESCKYGWMGSKQSGAARRASMDLTRALADLRRVEA